MNHKKIEVYTASSFTDLLASPVFYSTAAIALVLGVSSILGFLQSPEKLKSTVDKITKKVIVLEQKEVSAEVVLNVRPAEDSIAPVSNRNRYSGLSKDLSESSFNEIKPVSFNYDITSKHFWDDLDTNTMPDVVKIEDNTQLGKGSLQFGVPVEPDFYEGSDDSRYSLKISRNIKI